MDYKTINQNNVEERMYQRWGRERKNYILSLTSYERKRKLWDELFPKFEQDDSYLLGKVF